MNIRSDYKQYTKVVRCAVMLLLETRKYRGSADKLFELEQCIFNLLEDHPVVLQKSYQRVPLIYSTIIHQIHKLGERIEYSRKSGHSNETLDVIIEDELEILSIMINDYILENSNEY